MAPSLNERFAQSGGAPIDVDGAQVIPLLRIAVTPGEVLCVEFLSANSSWSQGLELKAERGTLAANDVAAPALRLWQDSAPREVRVTAVGPRTGSVKVWNIWRYADPVTHAFVNNAGMQVAASDDEWLLRCSDGYGDLDFSNLVVRLRLLRD